MREPAIDAVARVIAMRGARRTVLGVVMSGIAGSLIASGRGFRLAGAETREQCAKQRDSCQEKQTRECDEIQAARPAYFVEAGMTYQDCISDGYACCGQIDWERNRNRGEDGRCKGEAQVEGCVFDRVVRRRCGDTPNCTFTPPLFPVVEDRNTR